MQYATNAQSQTIETFHNMERLVSTSWETHQWMITMNLGL
jgi:hypothetical protein